MLITTVGVDQACGMAKADGLSVVGVYQDIVYHCRYDGEEKHRCNLVPRLMHPCVDALSAGLTRSEGEHGGRPRPAKE